MHQVCLLPKTIHGHVHLEPQANGKDIKRVLQYSFPTQYDVGVDNNGYKPVSFLEVKEIINDRINKLVHQYSKFINI